MQARASHEKAVHLYVGASVRPLVCLCQTRDLWQNEKNLYAHSYTTRKIIYPNADFQSIFARRAKLNVNFALSEPPLGAVAVLIIAFRNLTNTVIQ